ncbi:MAG TPA: DUF4910 domain-containing protein, partial [Stellaceae bacterium]|nr:DUF4910 domain-containing protein [Stellaceae bacterium]
YVCHPSMANNELSGPAVATALAQRLMAMPERRLTYRILFLPETIGSIVYLSRNLAEMQRRVIAGFVLTCLGDERTWSFMPSRRGDTLADRIARHVLDRAAGFYEAYSFLERGSDERQYCSPLVDLPVVSIMRSKYGTYPEYHTSEDDLSLVTARGLEDGARMLLRCLMLLERNHRYRATIPCEPQMGKRGLYPTLSRDGSAQTVRDTMNVLAYADGESDVIRLAETLGLDAGRVADLAELLLGHGLLERV